MGITLVSAVLAMVRGFSREVLSVVSWAAAAVAAYVFYKPVVPFLAPYISNDTIAYIGLPGLVFIITLIVVSIITMKIADFIIDSRIGALDHTRLSIRSSTRCSARRGCDVVFQLARYRKSAGMGGTGQIKADDRRARCKTGCAFAGRPGSTHSEAY